MEKVADAKVVIIENVCDKCGKGLMKPHGDTVLMSCPPQYPHRCDECGNIENYPFTYPYHRIVPIEPLRNPEKEEIAYD